MGTMIAAALACCISTPYSSPSNRRQFLLQKPMATKFTTGQAIERSRKGIGGRPRGAPTAVNSLSDASSAPFRSFTRPLNSHQPSIIPPTAASRVSPPEIIVACGGVTAAQNSESDCNFPASRNKMRRRLMPLSAHRLRKWISCKSAA
jgi:hypothetical protein